MSARWSATTRITSRRSVSYKLNLRGPSVIVQTACSTSLVAVYIGLPEPAVGQCDMALAGGVSVSVPQKKGYFYQAGGIVSPDGHCRPFDADAQGTVFGNGVGVVVLKRLADAIADGDNDPRGHPGLGAQQRRRAQGRLHRAQRRRAGRR